MGAEHPRIRVLVAGGDTEIVHPVARAIESLGHEVIEEVEPGRVGDVTAARAPDVALVVLGESSDDSLRMISSIGRAATCPVIAALPAEDPPFVNEAARRGIFAYLTVGDDTAQLQSSIDIALRRFVEFRELEGAFGRRAVTERAKGVLMERHGVGEEEAFNMLRAQARSTNRKIVDVAGAVLEGLPLLRRRPGDEQESAGD